MWEQKRRDAVRNRIEARKAIKRDLRDLTPDILLAKITDLTKRVTSYPQERPEDPPLPPDLDEARRIASEAESFFSMDCRTMSDTCDAAAKKSENELNDARLNEAGLTARIKVADDRKLESEKPARRGQKYSSR